MPAASKPLNIVSWVTRLVAAGILAMAGVTKLTGDEGSAYIFEELLGAPSFATMGVGAAEIVAVVLLLVPKAVLAGSALAILLMVGAIGSHLTKLGISIEVPVDASEPVAAIAGPSLFVMAVVVMVAAVTTLLLQLPRKKDNSQSGATAA